MVFAADTDLDAEPEVVYRCWDLFVQGWTTSLDGDLGTPAGRELRTLEIYAYPGYQRHEALAAGQEFQPIDEEGPFYSAIRAAWKAGDVYCEDDLYLYVPGAVLTVKVVEEAVRRWHRRRFPASAQTVYVDLGDCPWPDDAGVRLSPAITRAEAEERVRAVERELLT
jgi:hypothetical protein